MAKGGKRELYQPTREYAVKTEVYAHGGAKCRWCRKKIGYGEKAVWVRRGSTEKFYHIRCYRRLK